MKGMVFTEFLEMVEAAHSPEVVDDLIDAANLPADGSYTAVGTYPCSDLVKLLALYSKHVGTPVEDLLRDFGVRLFKRFYQQYPEFFEGGLDTFSFLEGVDAYIHMEVRKLYPEAELPRFEHERTDEHTLRLIYHSNRPLARLAEGLIRGCAAHFDEAIELTVSDLSQGAGTSAEFLVARRQST